MKKIIITAIFIVFLFSCGHIKSFFSTDKLSDQSLYHFKVQEHHLSHDIERTHFKTIKLDTTYDLDFPLEGSSVSLENIFEKPEELPQHLETKIITKKIRLSQRDRFLLKIIHSTGQHFVLPYVTNSHNVQMPIKLMYERQTDEMFKEKNFLVKVPDAGEYLFYFISLSPKNVLFKSAFFFSEQQNDRLTKNNNCSDYLAYNLRHCIAFECRVDMTPSFLPMTTPPEKIYYQYNILPKKDFCQISVSSNIDQGQQCLIPKDFNYLIQDCSYPMKDPYFSQKINELNQLYYKLQTSKDIQDNTAKIQQLWTREYPLSLMCSKELEFQLPDLDLLLKKYCKYLPYDKKSTLVEWKKDLEAKIALKQASLNFKSATLAKESNQGSNNQYIQLLEDIKSKKDSCFKNKNSKVCNELAEFYQEQKDYGAAAEIYEKGCEKGDGLSCQKAGLSYSQAKLRQKARIYELKGCQLNDSISCYNLACSYCVENNPQKALTFFKKHMTLGVEDKMHIVFDPTIQCLKNTLEFKKFKNKALAP